MGRHRMKIKIGIYAIFAPDNAVYVGQTSYLTNRFSQLKRRCNDFLKDSFDKYGRENHKFIVLHEFNTHCTQQHLDYAERFYIAHLRLLGHTILNIREGGKDGRLHPDSIYKIACRNVGRKDSAETILKKSIAVSGSNNPRYGVMGIDNVLSFKVNQLSKCGEFVKEWSAVREITRELGVDNGSIVKCIQGKRKSAGGFKWQYVKSEIISN